MAKDTANFLRLMNERNDRIAEAERTPPTMVGIDHVREQRMEEYRKKWGPTLSAKTHASSRVHRARFVGNAEGAFRGEGSHGAGPGHDQA